MYYLPLGLLLILSGCVSSPSLLERQNSADELAHLQNWHRKEIHTAQFDLISYQPRRSSDKNLLTIYIEGDGLAWLTKHTVSTNPTPINPTGLKLALNHPLGNSAYLARPCQYTSDTAARNCSKDYWTDSRFAEEVIASSNEALNNLKTTFSAQQLQLIGFSGGGAIAALLAARRDDVKRLITVAGNLDHQSWTTFHKLSPLSNSLNPIDYHKQLANVEQIHFVGANDKVIPFFLSQDFVSTFNSDQKVRLIIIPKFNHHCCWVNAWSKLLLTLEK